MKKTLKLTQIFLLFCFSNMSAQNNQPWYADDIYYDTNEKDINYIEIIEYQEDYDNSDSIIKSYDNTMSYSMRINRFHRDYFGSSISFNYGYFHDPYLYNGFGCSFGYDPFYHY